MVNKLSHAYIANEDAAVKLAMAAVCNGASGAGANEINPCGACKDCKKAANGIHPDITTISPMESKRGISVDQIRSLKADVPIMPSEAAKKAYIIEESDTMSASAQNAFLQMLEEPPSHTVFILKTANPHALLATVRSRCVDVTLGARPAKPTDAGDESETTEIAKLAEEFISALGDNMKLARIMFRIDKLDKPGFTDFAALAREKLSPKLRVTAERDRAISVAYQLTKAAEMLDSNVNVGHISGMLCAELVIAAH